MLILWRGGRPEMVLGRRIDGRGVEMGLRARIVATLVAARAPADPLSQQPHTPCLLQYTPILCYRGLLRGGGKRHRRERGPASPYGNSNDT